MNKAEVKERLVDLIGEIDNIDLRGHRRDSRVQAAVAEAWEGLDKAISQLETEEQ